MGNRYFSFIKI